MFCVLSQCILFRQFNESEELNTDFFTASIIISHSSSLSTLFPCVLSNDLRKERKCDVNVMQVGKLCDVIYEQINMIICPNLIHSENIPYKRFDQRDAYSFVLLLCCNECIQCRVTYMVYSMHIYDTCRLAFCYIQVNKQEKACRWINISSNADSFLVCLFVWCTHWCIYRKCQRHCHVRKSHFLQKFVNIFNQRSLETFVLLTSESQKVNDDTTGQSLKKTTLKMGMWDIS